MKNTGIWLDKTRALIVILESGSETMSSISSDIEHFKISGGSGTKFKGGPQDVVQDSKYLEREKHQFKAYFKNIVSEIKNSDAIVVFGPAATNKKFKKELEEHYQELNAKVQDVIKVDSMTDNQIKSLVINFFEKH